MATQIVKRGIATATKNMSAAASTGPNPGHAAGSWKLWKRLSLFVAIPAVGLCMLNTYLEHQKMTVHRPEFKKYEYLHIRNKRFPWGEGQKSLFHNPHVNALPEGYEDGHDGGHH